jgi:outer membrane protein W
MKKILLSIAIAAISAFATSAPKTHDGFFMNITAGIGYGSFSDDLSNGNSIEASGLQTEGDFKIGGTIFPNLILHATFQLNVIHSEFDCKSEDEHYKINHDGFNTFLFGAGLTYYFPNEQNIFVSASAGITDYSVTFGQFSLPILDLDAGFGFVLSVGKEWWVGNEWGIGIAASFTHTSAKGEYADVKNDASTNNFSFKASFTFN